MASAFSAQNRPYSRSLRKGHLRAGHAGSCDKDKLGPMGSGWLKLPRNGTARKLCKNERKSLIATHCLPDGNVRWLRFCAGERTRFQSETAIPAPGGAASRVLEETQGKLSRKETALPDDP